MQVYWVELRGGDMPDAEVGGLVLFSDRAETVIGFVGEVDHKEERLLIYLFDPMPKQDFAIVVHESIEKKVWLDKLTAICEANPKTKEAWSKLPLP